MTSSTTPNPKEFLADAHKALLPDKITIEALKATTKARMHLPTVKSCYVIVLRDTWKQTVLEKVKVKEAFRVTNIDVKDIPDELNTTPECTTFIAASNAWLDENQFVCIDVGTSHILRVAKGYVTFASKEDFEKNL